MAAAPRVYDDAFAELDVPATHQQNLLAAQATTTQTVPAIEPAQPVTSAQAPGAIPGVATPQSPSSSAGANVRDPLGAARIDPDGNDDPEASGTGTLPAQGHFEVGRPPLSLRQICDLTPLGDALYAVHALSPLGADGATIFRVIARRTSDLSQLPSTGIDPGEPTKGGGAGQGFLRARAIDGRLFVPDADRLTTASGCSIGARKDISSFLEATAPSPTRRVRTTAHQRARRQTAKLAQSCCRVRTMTST
ncbi:MAG: hypothetical protein QM784_25470 [Polyangiaceae bacterium]